MVEERFDIGLSELGRVHEGAGTSGVETDEARDPPEVGLLGPVAHVAQTSSLADVVEEGRHGVWGGYAVRDSAALRV